MVSFTSDWRFSPARSRESSRHCWMPKDVSYAEIESPTATTLLSDDRPAVPRTDAYLHCQYRDGVSRERRPNPLRFPTDQHLIERDSRVLDLGCADGTLLKLLHDSKAARGYGVEISDATLACVKMAST